MVPINDVVIPVALTSFERRALEAKGAFPRAGFGGRLVFGQGKLTGIAIPRAEKVNGFDANRGAHLEGELNGSHDDER